MPEIQGPIDIKRNEDGSATISFATAARDAAYSVSDFRRTNSQSTTMVSNSWPNGMAKNVLDGRDKFVDPIQLGFNHKYNELFYLIYKTYGSIRSVCSMLTDFACIPFQFNIDESKDKNGRIEKYYKDFFTSVGLNNINRQIFREYFAIGNSYLLPHTRIVEPSEVDSSEFYNLTASMVKKCGLDPSKKWAIDQSTEKFVVVGEKNDKTISMPVSYEILPPTQVQVLGASVFKQYALSIPKSAASVIQKLPSIQKTKIHPKILTGVNKKDNGKPEIVFDGDEIIHLAYEKMQWEQYGHPFWWQAYYRIASTDTMLDADRSMSLNGLQTIIKVTIGDKDNIPTEQDIMACAEMFKTSSNTLTVFWNYTLNVEYVQPRFENVDEDKYKAANDQIATELGIPQFLTGGDARLSNAVAQQILKAIVQKINTAQDMLIEQFLEPQIRILQEAKGFRVAPKPAKQLNVLYDLDTVHKIVMNYLDRSVVSRKSAIGLMHTLGLPNDFDTVVEQKRDELELEKEGLFVPGGSPYNSSKETQENTPSNSRPTDSVSPDYKKERKSPKVKM